jgi:uncharacterized membrane protein YcaP (DUF421 family)
MPLRSPQPAPAPLTDLDQSTLFDTVIRPLLGSNEEAQKLAVSKLFHPDVKLVNHLSAVSVLFVAHLIASATTACLR